MKISFGSACGGLMTLIVLSLNTATAFCQPDSILWFTIDGGGGYSFGGAFEIQGSIGQHDTGPVMIGDSFELTSGFMTAFSPGNIAGPILLDGDMDTLDVGTNPDIGLPAGAWSFPPHYAILDAVEMNAPDMSIVQTSWFDPATPGNSLLLDNSEEQGTIHLPNLLNRRIYESQGVLVQVRFDIFVPTQGISGGSIYVGGDHGGGGFNRFLDRGPQLAWSADGTIQITVQDGNNQVVVPSFPFGQWQSVQMEIDLASDTFDLYWGLQGQALDLINVNLGFRSGTQDHLDRFTFAHFTEVGTPAYSAIDNVSVQLVKCATGPVVPSAMTVFRGFQIDGTLEDVFESDDARVRFNPGFVLNSSEAPVWLIFDAVLQCDNPIHLEIELESQAGTPGLTSTMEAWNWTLAAYDVVDISATSFNNDTVVTVDLNSGIANYVQVATGAVRTRVGWRKTGLTLNFPWEVRVDQLVWISE